MLTQECILLFGQRIQQTTLTRCISPMQISNQNNNYMHNYATNLHSNIKINEHFQTNQKIFLNYNYNRICIVQLYSAVQGRLTVLQLSLIHI